MSVPAYKIETLTGAVLDHTIETEATFNFKEILTDGVGYFSFTVPSRKIDYVYNDIAQNDKVKFYVGEDTVPANPNFIGYVGDISSPLKTEAGFIRVISGLSQGEVLLNRLKKNKYYTGTNASVIVAEWATDLGLGVGDITADANQPDIEVRTQTYFDLLRYISDYWINAGNQIKKDFFVDVDFDLVWKVRPFRTTGVETFTVGENILFYNVRTKKEPVKNSITVLGEATKPRPADKDSYTEPASSPPPGWSASVGTVDRNNAAPLHAGSWYIEGNDDAATQTCTFKYDLPRLTIRDINHLYVWSIVTPAVPATAKVRLHAPDNANYFENDFTPVGAWGQDDYSLGPDNVYDATHNPNGTWVATGSPNWWDIEYIEFHVVWVGGVNLVRIDGIWFYPDRWSATVSNAASITSYGQRDLEVTDEKLHSDADCEKRAETMLYMLKDAPTQINVAVKGNNNVLVGDRIPMTISAEGINAANYDIISVEQVVNSTVGWQTRAVMVDSANVREPLLTSATRERVQFKRGLRELATELQRIK